MSQSTSTSQRVLQLSALLQNSATVLPVFVRFQKVDQYLTIPVMDVIINGDTVEVNTTEGSHSISMESLIDIVVFRDASGKSVFLTEFSTGGDIAAEERAMIEIWDRVEAEKLSRAAKRIIDEEIQEQIVRNREEQKLGSRGARKDEVIQERLAA